jgi:hypothetical protein
MENVKNVFDGFNPNGWKSDAKDCYFGTAFKEGYIGFLVETRYFMNRFTRATFVGNLRFEGSMDGLTYTTIFIVDEEIHEGWNYYTFDSGEEPKYRFYRYYGSETGSCMVGEAGFRGYEVIANSDKTYKCSSKVILNGVAKNLVGDINYVNTLTPTLTSISPRFGTVTGGEEISFTGLGFGTDPTKI